MNSFIQLHRLLPATTVWTVCIITLFSCTPESAVAPTVDSSTLLDDIAVKLALATYNDLDVRAASMQTAITALTQNPTEQNLASAQAAWRALRIPWEQSECFAFGPVITQGIDANLDDWPVNTNDINALLASPTPLTPASIPQLQTTLKGFHAIEYVLFGSDHTRKAADLTPREREYLAALASDFTRLTGQLLHAWDANGGNFARNFSNAGSTGSVYTSRTAALQELVNSMIGICDELANAKIEEPLSSGNASLAESQFSDNTLDDYLDNLRGVENLYLGRFRQSGQGLATIVSGRDPALDSRVRLQLGAALTALRKVQGPFSSAIVTSQPQLRFAQEQINKLRTTLEEEVSPLLIGNEG